LRVVPATLQQIGLVVVLLVVVRFIIVEAATVLSGPAADVVFVHRGVSSVEGKEGRLTPESVGMTTSFRFAGTCHALCRQGCSRATGLFAPGIGLRRRSLRKRTGEVAALWPRLASAFGPQWTRRFAEWAAGRPPGGALRDGFDFAPSLAAAGELPDLAAEELAETNARWRYDGTGSSPARRRRLASLVLRFRRGAR
jgi:hypothetical protein